MFTAATGKFVMQFDPLGEGNYGFAPICSQILSQVKLQVVLQMSSVLIFYVMEGVEQDCF